jgi:hypothetical protein
VSGVACYVRGVPSYLEGLRVDWGWKALKDPERVIVHRLEAALHADPTTHTTETFKSWLAAASNELGGRSIRGRGSDDAGEHTWAAFNGSVRINDSYDPSGECPDLPTAEQFRSAGITKIWTPLFWPEEQLTAMLARVAQLDISMSALVERAWRTAADREPPELPTSTTKCKQSVYLSLDVWSDISARATALDRCMSWLVQRAVAILLAG